MHVRDHPASVTSSSKSADGPIWRRHKLPIHSGGSVKLPRASKYKSTHPRMCVRTCEPRKNLMLLDNASQGTQRPQASKPCFPARASKESWSNPAHRVVRPVGTTSSLILTYLTPSACRLATCNNFRLENENSNMHRLQSSSPNLMPDQIR